MTPQTTFSLCLSSKILGQVRIHTLDDNVSLVREYSTGLETFQLLEETWHPPSWISTASDRYLMYRHSAQTPCRFRISVVNTGRNKGFIVASYDHPQQETVRNRYITQERTAKRIFDQVWL